MYIVICIYTRPDGGFGETPGKLLILSKPNPYPKYVRTPAQKLCKILNLYNPFGRFNGRLSSVTRAERVATVYEQALVCLSNKEIVDASRGRRFHCKMANNRLIPFFLIVLA